MIFDTGLKIDDLNSGPFKKITIEKEEIVIGKKNDRIFAFNNICPHKGASLSKGSLNGDNIVCYMHGYEYNIFTGKLEKMKSWKKDSTWVEQNDQWRYSGNLKTYKVHIDRDKILIELGP
ncbi:Rieske (2Fe-2S) protein [Candidatus Nitrosocosmicus franklandus]|uniref:Rieske 2Fe-2S iron-sulphur domain protein n=1 Tax=Candidatus Nitrosocosmicus franklandianus TaxID=1798806 RepID=A0A484I900_9ARCH|nr:Rieske 2Fe-2S domain-containing protein [Candidatus Nitrosocosmicus franklandus]VFJ13213.1 Putative Rieske 2Fe-2S iron-sulphur domain protein [Candidatus Nitrosocosmicus franklandus]